MICESAREAIVEAQSGNLGENELRELHTHLASCSGCSIEADALRSWWDSLDAYAPPPISPDARRRLMESVVGSIAGGSPRPPYLTRHRVRRTALYAALALGGWGIGWLGARARFSEDSPISAGAPAVQTTNASQRASEGSPFLLLILGESSQPARTPAETKAVVAEYRRWAEGLARDGKLVSAGKLTDESGLVVKGTAALPLAASGEDRVTGFFVIRARDLTEATRTAAECPHIKRGGRIELRAIETT